MTTKITDKNISSIANLFVSWQSVITADGSTTTTGVAGRGYFINTTSAAHTFTLPTIATAGDTISIKDYAGTFASNKLTIDRNGHNIQGAANNSLIGTNRASVTLVYIDVTRGWEFVKESNVANLEAPVFTSATGGTITTSGNFKIHSFTGDGCFVVSSLGNSPTVPTGGPSNVDYLVVAGGGSGTSAGGGAGGYRTTFPSPACNAGSFPISSTTYPITVGAGGVGPTPAPTIGTKGSDSIFSTITSAGGGQGGIIFSPLPQPGKDGGSGGGATGFPSGPGQIPAGSGNTPPVSPPQGNNGGPGGPGGPCMTGGGGGGAGAAGGAANSTFSPLGAGVGGVGSPNIILDSPTVGTPGPAPGRYYAGGGGGSNHAGDPRGNADGGAGGGGPGVAPVAGGTAGTANTGGGGGGSTQGSGAAGGKGIVIIRYKFQ
jgi:hypothetical protein